MKIGIQVYRGETKLNFASKIEDLVDDNIIISMPMQSNRIFYTHIDEIIRLFFPKKDSLYCADCVVIGKTYKPVPVLKLKMLGNPYKNQRRDYFRLDLSTKIRVKLPSTQDVINGVTLNLSGSGALIVSDCSFNKGDIVEVKIPAVSDDLLLKAEVVRCQTDFTRKVKPYSIAMKYIEINERQRDIIIKFLLREQRRLRKKGLI